jgi:hypothetical protein
LLIPLDDVGWSNIGRIRVTASFPQRTSLPEQVPGLVERDLEPLQAVSVVIGRVPRRLSFPELVLLGDELLDRSVDLLIVHQSS